MRFYGEIQRVDEEQRMVWGYASTEQRALDGLVITRDAMAGALDEYMEYANIREMHQASAVGVAREAMVDDKGLWIGAYVVDDDAWKKVVERVYKGFSIGAKITRRDDEDKTLVRGISLREISLVDRPSDPGAKFDTFRAADFQDGELDEEDPVERGEGEEEPGYRYVLRGSDPETAEVVDTYRRDFTSKQRESAAKTGAAMPDGSFPIENRADLENAIRAFGRAKNKRAVKRHIEKRAKALGAEDLIPDSWKEGGDDKKRAAELDNTDGAGAPEVVERTDPTAEVPEAAPGADPGTGGADPAKTEVELALEAARAAAADLQRAVEPEPEPEPEPAIMRMEVPEIRRGMYSVGHLASLLQSVAYMVQDAQFETEVEGDNSPVPGKLRSALIALAQAYKAMSDEEVAELLAGCNIDVELENGVIAFAAASGGLERDGATITDEQNALIQRGLNALIERGFTPAVPHVEPNAEVEDLRRQVADFQERETTVARQVGELQEVLRTTLEGIEEKIERKVSEALERPAPAKTVGPGIRTVGKGEDVAGSAEQVERVAPLTEEEVANHLATLPEEERALLLTRAALARPMSLSAMRSPRLAPKATA